MAKVSITGELRHLAAAHKYAQMLADYISKGSQFWCFGSLGGFERNYDAMAANIRKIHLKLPGDKPWPTEASLSERTCDNFWYMLSIFISMNTIRYWQSSAQTLISKLIRCFPG